MDSFRASSVNFMALGATDAADGGGEGDLDDRPLWDNSVKFNLEVSSSIASAAEPPLVERAFRNAEDTAITLVASSMLKPCDSIVWKTY